MSSVEVENQEIISGFASVMDALTEEQPNSFGANGHPFTADSGAMIQQAEVSGSDPKEMSAKFVIVTRQKEVNRHNNKVQITKSKFGEGLRTDAHQQTPVVLFEHGSFPFPIGLSERKGKYLVKKSASKATAEVVFSQTLPEAAVVFGLVDEGIVRMASIGFNPMKAKRLPQMKKSSAEDGVEDVHALHGGFDFVETLLLEWSLVGMGADQGSFRQLLDRGHINGERVTSRFRPVLQQLAGPLNVWAPGFDLAQDLGGVPDAETEVVSDVDAVQQSVDPVVEDQSIAHFNGEVGITIEDVLQFGLLDDRLRSKMFKAWVKDDEKSVEQLVVGTEGYSGARLHELVAYAKELSVDGGSDHEEEEETSIGAALSLALKKIEEQSEAVDGVQQTYEQPDCSTSHQSAQESEQVETEVVVPEERQPQRLNVNLALVGKGIVKGVKKPILQQEVGSAVEMVVQKGFEQMEEKVLDALDKKIKARIGVLS